MDYLNTIYYQYITDIYNPIKEFIGEFNLKYTTGNIKLSSSNSVASSVIQTNIELLSGKKINIHLRALFDEDFIRDVSSQNSFHDKSFKKVIRPLLNNKIIRAWGYIKTTEGYGFNIVLIESNDDVYGEWYILLNSSSGMSRQTRVDPFPFEFNEIELEIQLIKSMHIYNTIVEPLNMDRFHAFIIRFNI